MWMVGSNCSLRQSSRLHVLYPCPSWFFHQLRTLVCHSERGSSPSMSAELIPGAWKFIRVVGLTYSFFAFLFVCSTRDWTLGLVLARQAFYYWVTPPAFCFPFLLDSGQEFQSSGFKETMSSLHLWHSNSQSWEIGGGSQLSILSFL
jgi:hypothetical protein